MPKSSLTHTKSSGDALFAVISLNVLASLDEEKIDKLKSINIRSVGDLLHYKPIHIAQLLMAIHRNEIGHDIHMNHFLDSVYENTLPSGLADLPIVAIEGIGTSTASIFSDPIFGITTVRELAVFPPYVEAQSFLLPDEEVFNEPPSAPEDLMPKIIGSTHSIARFNSYIKDEEIPLEELNVQYNRGVPNPELYGIFMHSNPKIFTGFIAGFKQKWVNIGTHLGEIIHSLALAPGESRNISVIEWCRRQASSREEGTTVDERLTNIFTHKRALNEVVKTPAREHLAGGTEMEAATKTSGYGLTAGYGGGSATGGSASVDLTELVQLPLKLAGSFLKSSAGAIGVSAVYSNNEQIGTIKSESNGFRAVLGQVQQSLNDSTVQNASNIRSLYSTIVVTDEQSEREEITTRNVTNYNHSHALTIQYYEVLQKYQVEVNLDTWQPILFIPFKPIDFSIETIQKYWHLLKEPFKEMFPEKFEEFDLSITNYSPSNMVFNSDGDIYVEKVKVTAALSVYPNYMFQRRTGIGISLTQYEDVTIDINDIFEIRFFNHDKSEEIFTHNTKESVKEYSFASTLRKLNSFGTVDVRLNTTTFLDEPYFLVKDVKASLSLIFQFQVKDISGNKLVVTRTYDHIENTYLQLYRTRNIGNIDPSNINIISNFDIDILSMIKNSSTDYAHTKAVEEVKAHFSHYRYGYTRYLLSMIESDQLIDIVESINLTVGGISKKLTSYIHPSPIGITENNLLFKPKKLPLDEDGNPLIEGDPMLQYIHDLNQTLEVYKAEQRKTRIQDIVYLPTSGVFAEAILGRANASEYVDPRRFWNWQDSPIPHLAPQIAAIQSGSQTVSDPSGLLTPNVPASNLNIINPPQYGLTTSLNEALKAVQNGAMFSDMSKSSDLISILGKLAELANSTATLAGNLSGKAAENALNGAVELGKQVAGMVNNASKMNLVSPPSNPTQKAAGLNTILQLNKQNRERNDYTPKEQTILASQGLYGITNPLDGDNLIASYDPNFIANSYYPDIETGCSQFKNYKELGGLQIPTGKKGNYSTRVFIRINNSTFDPEYCFDSNVHIEDRRMFEQIHQEYFSEVGYLGKFGKEIIDFFNTTKYELIFELNNKKESNLWTNSPLKNDEESADTFSDITKIWFYYNWKRVRSKAKEINENKINNENDVKSELRLSGLYVEMLHVLQYDYEYDKEKYFQDKLSSKKYLGELILENAEIFGTIYGYLPGESRSKNLLNEQIKAIIQFRNNKNMSIDANVLSPIICARNWFLAKGVSSIDLDHYGIILDDENKQFAFDNNLDFSNCICD